MKRILISQNCDNNGTDSLVVDGKILSDEDSVVRYGRIISGTDNWAEIYKDDFIEIKKNDNQLLLKSFYISKDLVGRPIYYLYCIEETDDAQIILDYLQKDSQLINKIVDRERTQELIIKIGESGKIKDKITKYIVVALGLSLLIYLFTKI